MKTTAPFTRGVALTLAFTLACAFGTALMAQSQSEVWVDDDYDSGTSGWGVTHFDTIPDGLDAVEAGGTVHVAAGGTRRRS